jgi:iron-sulfur cluster assembly accessory protein
MVAGGAPLVLTEACVQRMKKLAERQGTPLVLRLAVEPGGCEGFQYEFTIISPDDVSGEEDVVVEENGAKVVVDQTSLELVKGSKIDYVSEIVRSAFVVASNPNADSGCGCGHSFNVS